MVMKERVSQCSSVTHYCVFSGVPGQLSSNAEGKKLEQQLLAVSAEYHQTSHPLDQNQKQKEREDLRDSMSGFSSAPQIAT